MLILPGFSIKESKLTRLSAPPRLADNAHRGSDGKHFVIMRRSQMAYVAYPRTTRGAWCTRSRASRSSPGSPAALIQARPNAHVIHRIEVAGSRLRGRDEVVHSA